MSGTTDRALASASGCDAAVKVFRETFTLMKLFAERKCPGPQGAQGPQGCAGIEGGGDDIKGKISQVVCAEFGKHATGLTEAFWSAMCDPPSSNPFARFIPPDHVYHWSPLGVVSGFVWLPAD